MDLNVGSIIKAGLLMAIIMPAFAFITITLPYNNPALGNGTQTQNVSMQLNSTALLINQNFIKTINGMNNTLLSTNGSFYANPTIFQAFAFILSGFGTVMQDMVEIPYLDLLSMNMLTSGLQLVLPSFIVGIIKISIALLYAYMLLSVFITGVSAIEKYNMKE
jgi:hypothetical protein